MSDPGTPPVTMEAVTIIGTGTGDGSPLKTGDVAQTPDHLPNLVIRVISPVIAIVVRAVVAFLTAATGVLTAAGLGGGKIFGAIDLHGILVLAGWVGVCAAIPITGKNLLTIFLGLEKKFPLWTGTI